MTIAQNYLAELNQETTVTRKMLERLPIEKSDWKPHPKSMALINLASHVAELVSWIPMVITGTELDFGKNPYSPFLPKNNAELLKFFDDNMKAATEVLNSASDEEMAKPWTLRSGEYIIFTLPKVAVLRSFTMNHMVHHRGQLSVYLRLLDIPIPGAYGPSADGE